MTVTDQTFVDYTYIGLNLLIACGLAGVIMGLTFLVGPRRPTPQKSAPYECGLTDVVAPPRRYPVRFLQVAMLFLIFDVEAVAFYPLAVQMRKMGFAGLAELAIFLVVLVLGYFYAWKKGAFEWNR